LPSISTEAGLACIASCSHAVLAVKTLRAPTGRARLESLARVLSAALMRVPSASQANRLCQITGLFTMEHIAEAAITSTLVPDCARRRSLMRHFDFYGIVLERQIRAHMHYLCESDTSGLWNFFELDNGGCARCGGQLKIIASKPFCA
jgi:hypothetical protein